MNAFLVDSSCGHWYCPNHGAIALKEELCNKAAFVTMQGGAGGLHKFFGKWVGYDLGEAA
ncbi:MAG: hypothetical protein FWD76_01220 [Firmicutes bacterium]|nr:hypothetical protein [Bacillota bacterium]